MHQPSVPQSQAIPGHQTQYQILKPGTGKDGAWDGRATGCLVERAHGATVHPPKNLGFMDVHSMKCMK